MLTARFLCMRTAAGDDMGVMQGLEGEELDGLVETDGESSTRGGREARECLIVRLCEESNATEVGCSFQIVFQVSSEAPAWRGECLFGESAVETGISWPPLKNIRVSTRPVLICSVCSSDNRLLATSSRVIVRRILVCSVDRALEVFVSDEESRDMG